MFFRIFIILIAGLLSLILAGCSTITIPSKDPPASTIALKETKECKRTSKISLYPNGKEWNECTRDLAKLAYEYAQMAANVYSSKDSTPFNLSQSLRPLEPLESLESGLQYRVYERIENGKRSEVIISFSGTNFNSWQDWIFGNIGLTQRSESLAIFDRVLTEYGIKPSVTGHSLGGALATQVSLCRDVKYNMVFDSSSRFSKRFCGASYENHNVSVAEFGEINKLLRIFGREPTQRYVSLNCLDEGNSLAQHNMAKLAACLTNIAALEDEAATKSKLKNRIPNNPNNWK